MKFLPSHIWIFTVSLTALLMTCAAQAEIYKWRDTKGVMNYADTPPPANIQAAEKLGESKPAWPLTSADAPKSTEEMPAVKKSPSQRTNPVEQKQADAQKAQETSQSIERQKAQNCAAARTSYRNYAIGGRIQNVNESGEKEFLSESQIQEGLARAQQEIDESCVQEE